MSERPNFPPVSRFSKAGRRKTSTSPRKTVQNVFSFCIGGGEMGCGKSRSRAQGLKPIIQGEGGGGNNEEEAAA